MILWSVALIVFSSILVQNEACFGFANNQCCAPACISDGNFKFCGDWLCGAGCLFSALQWSGCRDCNWCGAMGYCDYNCPYAACLGAPQSPCSISTNCDWWPSVGVCLNTGVGDPRTCESAAQSVCIATTACTFCATLGYCSNLNEACSTTCTGLAQKYCNSSTGCSWCSDLGYCTNKANVCVDTCLSLTPPGNSVCNSASACRWCDLHNGRCKSKSDPCKTESLTPDHSESLTHSLTASDSKSVGSESPEVTSSDSDTLTSTWTVTSSSTRTLTLSDSNSRSPTFTGTQSVSLSVSDSRSITASSDQSVTLSFTVSQSASSSVSLTLTESPTRSPSLSVSDTASVTESQTMTLTTSSSDSPSATTTISSSASLSGSPSASPSITESLSASDFFEFPTIDVCFMEESLHIQNPFVVTIVGRNFRENDRFLIARDRFACLNGSLVANERVFWVSPDSKMTILRYTVETMDAFAICYYSNQFSRIFNLSCPQVFTPGGLAPWANAEILSNIGSNLTIGSVSLEEVNRQQCESAFVLGYNFNGAVPLVNPISMEAQFGNSSQRVRAGESCLFIITQLDDPSHHDGGDVINSMNSSSVFDKPYLITFDSLLATADRLTIWLENESNYSRTNFIPLNITSEWPETCAQEIDGYFPAVSITRGTQHVRLPPQQIIVQACSATGDTRGLYAGFKYSRVDTVCPNDCRDGNGFGHGVCENTTTQCLCDPGFSGPSCLPSTCNSMAASMTPNVTAGKGNYSFSGVGHCGATLRADGSNLKIAGGFDVALQFKKVSFNSTNCSEAFATVRHESLDGKVLTTICSSDRIAIEAGLFPIVFVSNTRMVHIEYKGLSPQDQLAVEFASVSSMCPGDIDRTGYVQAASYCSGRGLCIDANVSALRAIPLSSKACSCFFPWATSSAGSTCDVCAFGQVPWTFPQCSSLPVCPWNCNGNGNCTDKGCRCEVPYYGKSCELKRPNVHIQASDRLSGRFALDGGSGSSPNAEGTFLSCLVSGCKKSTRSIGEGFFATDPLAQTVLAVDEKAGTATRRFRAEGGSPTDQPVAADEGISLNSVVAAGSVGDYLLQTNILHSRLDAAGQMTIATWVCVTPSSSGFVYAKIDAAFYADGRIPLLEAAAFDIQDRHAPLSSLRLRNTNSSIYFAIFVNGPHQRIDVMSVDVGIRDSDNVTAPVSACTSSSAPDCTSSGVGQGRDSWFYSRSFLLNSEFRQRLFDGNWHHLAVTVRRGSGRWEGQVYVDGGTVDGNVNFAQCIPFLPNVISNASGAHVVKSALGDALITKVSNEGAVVIGYGLIGTLDEIRLYTPWLTQYSIVQIGGAIFSSALSISTDVLLISIVVCLATVVGSSVLFFGRREGLRMAEHVRNISVSSSSSEDEEGEEEEDDGKYDKQDEERKSAMRSAAADKCLKRAEGQIDTNINEWSVNAVQRTPSTEGKLAIEVDSGSDEEFWALFDEEMDEEDRAMAHEHFPDVPVSAVFSATLPSLALPITPHNVQDDHPDINEQKAPRQKPPQQSAVSIFETVEAQEMFRSMSIKESKSARSSRVIRSAAVASGNAMTMAANAGLGLKGFQSMGDSSLMAVARGATIAQDVWQTIAIHMSGFPWPENFKLSFGSAIAIVSLNFEVSFTISFEITFYVCATVGLVASLFLSMLTLWELARSKEDIEAERIAREAEMKLQLESSNTFHASRTPKEKMAWLSMFVLTTLYMPITRNSVIGAFCYTSIQCEFDCYHEQRHWNIVYLSAVQMFCVTLGVPVFLFLATYKARKRFIGNRIEKSENDPGMEEDTTLESDWRQFLSIDHSPYAGAYENFKFRWCFFQVILVLSKATCVFLALGLDTNTSPQLLCITALHSLMSFAIGYTNPFIADISNLISMVGQVFVVLTLGLNAVSRLNPDETIGVVGGYALIGTAVICVVIQFYLLASHISIAQLVAGIRAMLPSLALWGTEPQRSRPIDEKNATHDAALANPLDAPTAGSAVALRKFEAFAEGDAPAEINEPEEKNQSPLENSRGRKKSNIAWN